MTKTNVDWTEEEDACLAGLARKGWSSQKIAEEINRRFGTGRTRNAVIGRANRQKNAKLLARRNQPSPMYRSDVSGGTVKTCQWPVGDPGDPAFHFCGEKAMAGKPYCEAHCLRAYRKADVTTEEAGNSGGLSQNKEVRHAA